MLARSALAQGLISVGTLLVGFLGGLRDGVEAPAPALEVKCDCQCACSSSWSLTLPFEVPEQAPAAGLGGVAVLVLWALWRLLVAAVASQARSEVRRPLALPAATR